MNESTHRDINHQILEILNKHIADIDQYSPFLDSASHTAHSKLQETLVD